MFVGLRNRIEEKRKDTARITPNMYVKIKCLNLDRSRVGMSS